MGMSKLTCREREREREERERERERLYIRAEGGSSNGGFVETLEFFAEMGEKIRTCLPCLLKHWNFSLNVRKD